jgi:ribonuclease VapC
MILDSSAIVAVVLRQPDWELIVARMEASPVIGVGAPTLTETSLVLAARLARDPRPKLARLLQVYGVVVVPFTQEHSTEATEAFLRYGKGRHPAALNFGDCLTYAGAKLADEPLLCLGDDFSRTDLRLVPLD